MQKRKWRQLRSFWGGRQCLVYGHTQTPRTPALTPATISPRTPRGPACTSRLSCLQHPGARLRRQRTPRHLEPDVVWGKSASVREAGGLRNSLRDTGSQRHPPPQVGGRAEEKRPPAPFPSPPLPLSLFPGVSTGCLLKGDTTGKTQPFLLSVCLNSYTLSSPESSLTPGQSGKIPQW